jgi:hypothetical protein
MGSHKPKDAQIPDFEVTLLGYDRGQVERCLTDLTARLEEALSRAESVPALHALLCDAHLEIDQLRLAAEERPSVANQLSMIMKVAEELHEQARREVAAVRAGAPAGTPGGLV